MDEETVVLESKASVEQQVSAQKLGWIPPTRFKGDPEKFVDADEYLRRGEEVLPIVKEHNKRLQTELEAVKAESVKTAAALKAAQDAIEQIEERHSVATQKAVEEARKQLKVQLAQASEAGDHAAIAELTDQMTQLKDAEKAAGPVEKKTEAAPPQFTPSAEMRAWNEENPWFGTNKRKTALALGIAQELREGGETSTGRAFFDKVTEEVEKELGAKESTPPRDKVEGARGGAGNDGGGRGKKSYASMPADAKAACDADIKQFVGAGKKYKTADEWRKRYAEIYFEEN